MTRPFWERTGQFVPYSGLKQGREPHCVYASIGGAVNQICHKSVWESATLYNDCKSLGQPNFDVAIRAVAPVQAEVAYEIASSRMSQLSEQEYLNELRQTVSEGGLAVVSFEVADGPLPGTPLAQYHMLTLVAFHESRYQVWDTNGYNGLLFESELLSGFEYLPVRDPRTGLAVPRPLLIVHPTQDCVLFRAALPLDYA